MVRVANTGISAIISPTGNITAPTHLFVRDTEVEKVAWRKGGTVYSVVGDLFAQICFALTMVAMVVAWSGYRRPKPRRKLPADVASSNGHR